MKLLTTLLCIFLATSCYAAEFNFKPVENGYWCDDATGRKILQTLKTRRLQLEQKTVDYNNLQSSFQDYIERTELKYKTLEESISVERSNWESDLIKSKQPGIGIFAGPAYGFVNQKVDLVVGIGIVWKIF